jgi:hypothetical protein
MDGKTRSRSLIVTVSALVLAIGAIGIGVASAQATGDTFTGCLKGGTLTKVAIGSEPLSTCPSSATEISWNEAGTPGVLGFYTRSLDISESLSANEQTQGTADCDTGDVATGGWGVREAIEPLLGPAVAGQPEQAGGWPVFGPAFCYPASRNIPTSAARSVRSSSQSISSSAKARLSG